MAEDVRIDKWLWAVRVYKTRSLATEACKNGRVKIDDQPVKASRNLKIGDVLAIHQNPLNKIVKVKAFLTNRVSAKLVVDYLEDLTPAEEYERVQMIRDLNWERRPRGLGRPTKQDRRQIDELKDYGEA
jgi:ribosome-associated heat shock protein Hsp15